MPTVFQLTYRPDLAASELLENLLSSIRGCKLTEEDYELLGKWTKVLEENLYFCGEHLRDISADEWYAMKIPLRLRTVGREQWGPHSSTELPAQVERSEPIILTRKRKEIKKSKSKTKTRRSHDSVMGMFPEPPNFSSSAKITKNPSSEDIGSNQGRRKRSLSRAASTHSVFKNLRDMGLARSESKDELLKISGDIVIGGDALVVASLMKDITGSDYHSDRAVKNLHICNENVEINFRNCSEIHSGEEMMTLPSTSNLDSKIILVAFSVIEPRTLNTIMLQYLPLVKQLEINFESTMILVGVDTHKRNNDDRKHISRLQSEQALKNLKALMYIEMGTNIGVLLQEVAKMIICNEKTERNKNSNWQSKVANLKRSIESKEAVQTLNLKKCKLEFLPPQVLFFRSSLTRLRMPHNQFKFFPDEIRMLDSLTDLDLQDNLIGDFPQDILQQKNLTKLNLENNKISVLPFTSADIRENLDIRLKGNPAYSSLQKLLKLSSGVSLDQGSGVSLIERFVCRELPSFGTELGELIAYEMEVYDEKEYTGIPFFVRAAVNQILSSPIEQEGVFRLEGNATRMQELQDTFNTHLHDAHFDKLEDLNIVCCLLKQWLRMLPVPLLKDMDVITFGKLQEKAAKMQNMKLYLETLPSSYFLVLSQIVRMLHIVRTNSDRNKMDTQNLATVMSPNLLSALENKGNPMEILNKIQEEQKSVAFIIDHYEELFVEKYLADPFHPAPLALRQHPKSVFHTKLVGKHKAITSCCFGGSGEGARIWTADEKGVIHIWHGISFSLVTVLDVKSRVNTLLACGNTMWVGTIENIGIYNIETGKSLKKIAKPGYNFIEHGEFIISSLYSNNEGTLLRVDKATYRIIKEVKFEDRILSMAVVNEQIWAACQGKMIRIVAADSLELVAQFDSIHEDEMNHLCVVPNDNGGDPEVWSSSKDKAIHVWNSRTRELEERLLSYHKHGVQGACCVGDQVWTYTWDAQLYIWDRATRDFLGHNHSYHARTISCIITNYSSEAGSSNEYWAISASYDHSLVVWKCKK